jgi:hypothetical protein
MKLENVKVGEAYMLKVGKNTVQVTVNGVAAKGKITVRTAGGKTISVADAGRLSAKGTAHGAPRKPGTPKTTKAAPGRNVGQQGAPDGKKERLSLLNGALAVLKGSGQPMNAKAMVEAILAKGMWSTKGKTPAATLYAAILREIQKKGDGARFVKTERGKFSLKS